MTNVTKGELARINKQVPGWFEEEVKKGIGLDDPFRKVVYNFMDKMSDYLVGKELRVSKIVSFLERSGEVRQHEVTRSKIWLYIHCWMWDHGLKLSNKETIKL